jgi:hypothetical protein
MNREEYLAHEQVVADRLTTVLHWDDAEGRGEVARGFVGEWSCYSADDFRRATDELIRADWRDLQAMLKGELVVDFTPATGDVLELPTPRSSGRL